MYFSFLEPGGLSAALTLFYALNIAQMKQNVLSCSNCVAGSLKCFCGNKFYIKHGKTSAGKQRYKCKSCSRTFIENPSSYTLETDMPFTKIENEVNSKSQKIENSVTSIQFWDIKVGWFGGFETSFKIEIPNGQRPFTGQPTHTDASFVSHSVIIKSIH
jgi:hypothetical protein